MDLIERVESYKVMFKECKALEPVSMALAKGYKSATPIQRLEIIRELDTELAEVYSVEIPVITAWVRDDNYVHSTKEIFLGEPSLERVFSINLGTTYKIRQGSHSISIYW